MTRLLLAALLTLAAIPAFAAASATEVAFPVGSWAASVLEIVAAIVLPVIVWTLRWLPASIQSLIRTAQVEQLLQKAISYGINATAGAVRDKTLTVNLGNQVAAEAVQYAVTNGPVWLSGWLGGSDGIRQRIIARLDVGEASLK